MRFGIFTQYSDGGGDGPRVCQVYELRYTYNNRLFAVPGNERILER